MCLLARNLPADTMPLAVLPPATSTPPEPQGAAAAVPPPAGHRSGEPDLPLPCPSCGYDLRATTAGRCPECGATIDETVRTGEATIPWQHRRSIGRLRAFMRTAWMAMRHAGLLARQAGRDVDYRGARRFHLICCTIAWLCVAPVCIPVWREIQASYGGGRPMPAILADANIVLAFAAGLFLWLFTASGLSSYFLHPKSLPVTLQNRAIAISYYAAAPLAL